MTRIKRGTISVKKREKLLCLTKGYRWDAKSKERAARERLLHGLSRMFRGRKEKKRNFRALWQTKINAAVRQNGLSYSKFVGALKKKNILFDRKILADLAQNEPKIFQKILEKIKE
jgi:large subunit ribosomal protein L20